MERGPLFGVMDLGLRPLLDGCVEIAERLSLG